MPSAEAYEITPRYWLAVDAATGLWAAGHTPEEAMENLRALVPTTWGGG